MRRTQVQTPRGMRDFIGAEAAAKRAVEEAFHRTFAGWGYQEVITPTVEFFEALALGDGPDLADKMFRFFDREGNALALRPEMTTPIGRLVGTRMREAPKPLRFYYVTNVFRYEEPRAGRGREFWQAGVEMLGSTTPAADAEVAALALASLEATGLDHFHVDIGQVGYFHGLLEEAGLDEEARHDVRQALLRRDYVAFDDVLASVALEPASKEALGRLPRLRGGMDVLDEAASLTRHPKAHAALDELRAIVAVLDHHGVADRIGIDLGMIKDLDYYTGMVLEGYADTVGFPLCTGGRYDGLIGRFGYPCPATGFVVTVEGVMMALARQRQAAGEPLPRPDVPPRWLVSAERGAEARALKLVQRLRRAGETVEFDVEGLEGDRLEAYARARRVEAWIWVPAGEGALEVEGPEALHDRLFQMLNRELV